MKKAFICLICTMLFALLLPGCENDDFATNAYKTLKSADITYVAVMESVAQAQAKGIITDAQREVINVKAHIYVDAFRAAATALYTWQVSREAKDKAAVLQGITESVDAVKNLVVSAASYGISINSKVAEVLK